MMNIHGRFSALLFTALFVLTLLCCSFLAAFGQVLSGAAVPFLRFTPDAQHQGMGRTGTGERFNSHAAFWNIAASAPEKRALGADSSHSNDATSSNKNIGVSLAMPLLSANNSFGLMSATVQGIDVGTGALTADVRYLTAFGSLPQGIPPFNEYVVSLGYAVAVSEEVRLGTMVSYVQSNLPDTVGQFSDVGRTITLSIGMLYAPDNLFGMPLNKRVSIGATLRNIGPSVAYQRFADPLPADFRFGISAEIFREGAHKIKAQGDFSTLLVNRRPNGSFDAVPVVLMTGWRNPLEVGLGAEYSFENRFFARMGYINDFARISSFHRLSLGAGVRLGTFTLDVAGDIPLAGTMTAAALTLRTPFGLVQ